MKILVFLLIILIHNSFSQEQRIRINQLGYLKESVKIAVFISQNEISPNEYYIKDALTEETVHKSKNIISFGNYWNFKSTFRLDFSSFKTEGAYFIECEGVRSPNFRINDDVYNGTADFLLKYMRQQRCGYNPFLKDSCHTNDGFIIYHPELDSTYIDVTGGWHDASDYLQYVTTSANATFQMMFAYLKNPDSFEDYFDENGNEGSNGIPDIVDEIKWGIDWLLKMNPEKDFMFNQIADDRDHSGYRLPTKDSVFYGIGLQRPVYFATGKPQGVMKYKNRSEGLASTAGKFSSAFTLASKILKNYYPEISNLLLQKGIEAYQTGMENPGVCQTAPCRAPYFYEEENYSDDMQLAATQLFNITNDKKYLEEAVIFGKMEPVTPWMGADTAKHYEWYPFVNLGHYFLVNENNYEKDLFINYLRKGIEGVFHKGKDNPYFIGIPFIWCSNNLIAAMLTQCRLYNELTGDTKYLEMEAALRDWLFGCNPWGTSMIVGLPANGDYPSDPHSAFTTLYNYPIDGGLVDGPVYASIFNKLIGIKLHYPDEYAVFQNDFVVYHDDYGDYSTNEPTMDGTASLTYYFSAIQKEGNKFNNYLYSHGGIIKGNPNEKIIYLIFSGDEYAEGTNSILESLEKNNIKGSFFLTGNFLRNFENETNKIIKFSNYVGPHSDKHLLYNDWNKRDSLLVTKEEFIVDLKNNFNELKKYGIEKNNSSIFLPPYEWYNDSISVWSKELGLSIISFTPGTTSNADYTTPEMKNYRSSEMIFNNILKYEKEYSLNGVIMLVHLGTHPDRADKFYYRLNELIEKLKEKGYKFKTVENL